MAAILDLRSAPQSQAWYKVHRSIIYAWFGLTVWTSFDVARFVLVVDP